jgi:hypothetical protein
VNTDNESETINFNRNSLEQSSQNQPPKQPMSFGGSEETIDSVQLINELLETFNAKSSLNKTSKTFEKNTQFLIGGQFGTRKKLSYNSESNLSSSLSVSLSDSSNKKTQKFYEIAGKIGGKHNYISSSDISMSDDSSFDETPEFKKETGFSETSDISDILLQDGSSKKSSSSSDEDETSSSDEDETTSSDITTSSSSGDETYSSDGGNIETDEIMEEYGLKKLSRYQNDDSSKRHEESVKRIMSNLSVDELTAKVYKAMLWKKIRDTHKELNNDDLSKELEKQSSDKKGMESFVKTLEKSEIEKIKQIISDKNKQEPKKFQKEDKKLSRFLAELSEELDDTNSDAYTSD